LAGGSPGAYDGGSGGGGGGSNGNGGGSSNKGKGKAPATQGQLTGGGIALSNPNRRTDGGSSPLGGGGGGGNGNSGGRSSMCTLTKCLLWALTALAALTD
jgi:hypothetical protein